MYILSIESSCDETAAAVVKDGRYVLSSIVNTQIAEHIKFGGVVPEVASRRHCENISAVVDAAIKKAGIKYSDLSAIAVTFAPGLIGALLVGVNFAKALAFSLNIPLVPVHHLRSHIAANYITYPDLKPPFLCLLVSGGNTVIAQVDDYTKFKIIGQTVDDAAGECMDKAARTLGLDYPGGVNLDKTATLPDTKKYPLPTPHTKGDFDFSFSGLKTAVINTVHNAAQKGEEIDVPVMCATVRQKVCDILIQRTMHAAEVYGSKKISVAGGVSANSELRRRMKSMCNEKGIELYIPDISLCGDNAAMVGAQGYYEYLSGNIADMHLNATATLPINYR